MADEDRIDRTTPPPESPRAVTRTSGELPAVDPEERSLGEQRAALARQLEALEDTLRYMGSVHPRRKATEARVEQLRMMLGVLDQEIGKSTG
jgi:uncharacterized protein YlxW (UPF0749 family)